MKEEKEYYEKYLRSNYPELFDTSRHFDFLQCMESNIHKLSNLCIGFLVRANVEFTEIMSPNSPGYLSLINLRDFKKRECINPLTIFYNKRYVTESFAQLTRPSACQRQKIEIVTPGVKNRKDNLRITSLYGIYGACNYLSKNEYAIMPYPIALGQVFKAFEDAFGYSIAIPSNEVFLDAQSAYNLVDKMLNDKMINKMILEYLSEFGEIEHEKFKSDDTCFNDYAL